MLPVFYTELEREKNLRINAQQQLLQAQAGQLQGELKGLQRAILDRVNEDQDLKLTLDDVQFKSNALFIPDKKKKNKKKQQPNKKGG